MLNSSSLFHHIWQNYKLVEPLYNCPGYRNLKYDKVASLVQINPPYKGVGCMDKDEQKIKVVSIFSIRALTRNLFVQYVQI